MQAAVGLSAPPLHHAAPVTSLRRPSVPSLSLHRRPGSLTLVLGCQINGDSSRFLFVIPSFIELNLGIRVDVNSHSYNWSCGASLIFPHLQHLMAQPGTLSLVLSGMFYKD